LSGAVLLCSQISIKSIAVTQTIFYFIIVYSFHSHSNSRTAFNSTVSKMKFGVVIILLSLLTRASCIFSATRRHLKKEKKSKSKESKSRDKNNGLKMGKRHPNILLIMVDEQRFPTVYDNVKLGDWFTKNLSAQTAMKRKSTELVSHYTASTACAPSRATIFTGQYGTLNGVAYTPGAAKLQKENLMYHLDFNTVPTMGDYFTEAGTFRSIQCAHKYMCFFFD
jgi:hypothetical protein